MTRAEERLLNPAPGSRIEAARLHGVDLTLTIEQLRRTPEERLRRMQQAARGLEAIRGKARANSLSKQINDEQRESG